MSPKKIIQIIGKQLPIYTTLLCLFCIGLFVLLMIRVDMVIRVTETGKEELQLVEDDLCVENSAAPFIYVQVRITVDQIPLATIKSQMRIDRQLPQPFLRGYYYLKTQNKMNDYVKNDLGLIVLNEDEKQAIKGGYADPKISNPDTKPLEVEAILKIDLVDDLISKKILYW